MSGSVEKRFRRKLSDRRPNGCIEWLGWKNNSGYGMLREGPKSGGHLLAHRVAYELQNGPIPDGMCVMHECDNRICVNHEHLKLGTHKQNMQDMVEKGRQRKSKLDIAKVFEMRANGMTHREIAMAFDVSRPLITLALLGKLS